MKNREVCMINRKKIAVVGGPISIPVDAVLSIVPTGSGKLAEQIASEFEKTFLAVSRIGNFPGEKRCSYDELNIQIEALDADVIIFLPHIPNFLVDSTESKIRAKKEGSCLKIFPTEKIVKKIKTIHKEALLVPFKMAEASMTKLEIIRWMLDIHAGFAVYSRLGVRGKYWIIDALGNEMEVTRDELPGAIVAKVKNYLYAIRRRSQRIREIVPEVPHLEKLIAFSKRMQPAFSQLIEKNASSGRWPGNFSFRCTHSFLSSRFKEGFVITKRNVDKTGLKEKDFVYVEGKLNNGMVQFSGDSEAVPSIDSPIHRVIYDELPEVNFIVHGHLHAKGDCVYEKELPFWPCGAENEGYEIVKVASSSSFNSLWVANVTGHGFVALISDENPEQALAKLSSLF